jgi:hypothetical protein
MGSYYANYSTGNNANPGTLISPKRDISGVNGLTSIAHGTSDSTQPSYLYLARGATWPQQRLVTTDGRSAANRLTIDEYGAGASRPTLDYQNVNLAAFTGVITGGSYTSLRNIRVENVGPTSGHTAIGGRGINWNQNEQNVEIFNCEVDFVSENGIVLRDCDGPVNVEGNWTRYTGQSFLSGVDNNYPPPIQLLRAPDMLDGTGSGTASDNVNEFGIGEGVSLWQCKDLVVTGGIGFALWAASQSINCCLRSGFSRTVSYGTTDTDYHRQNNRCGYGLSSRVEHEGNSPGNDARASLHDDVWHDLNLVAFVNYGIEVASQNANAPASHLMRYIHNTFVDNYYNVRFVSNNNADAGSYYANNSHHVYGTASHSNMAAGNGDVPSGMTFDYNNWEGSLSSRQAAFIGANDTTAFGVTKTSGWTSLDAITDLGAWSITSGALSADAIAENFRPTSLEETLFLLDSPYNDWFGDPGLEQPGAMLFEAAEAEAPIFRRFMLVTA